MKRGVTRMIYYVDGKCASVKAATQAEHDNHCEFVSRLLDTYEKEQGAKSVPVKNSDFNPRANDSVFVVTIHAEFEWRYVPAPTVGNADDTDVVTIKRGYTNL